jgi:hypothetical protein
MHQGPTAAVGAEQARWVLAVGCAAQRVHLRLTSSQVTQTHYRRILSFTAQDPKPLVQGKLSPLSPHH